MLPSGPATQVQRIGCPLYHVVGQDNRHRFPGHIAEETSQRQTFPRTVHFDSDNVIPSVEDDLDVSSRQATHLRQRELDYSSRNLQDDFVGPRIVELEDDPTSPIVKRRRVEDNRSRPVKVMYHHPSDRPMPASRLGPIISQQDSDHPGPISGAMGNTALHGVQYAQAESKPVIQRPNVQQTTRYQPVGGFMQRQEDEFAHQRYAPSSFPSLRPGPQLHEHSSLLPDPSQNRLPQGLPARHKPDHSGSNAKSIFGLHEPSQTLRLQQTSSSARGVKELLSNEAPRVHDVQTKGMYQPLPVRPRPQHPNDNNGPPRYDRPASDHMYIAPSGIGASGAGLQERMHPRPGYVYRNEYDKMAQAPLPSGRLPQRDDVNQWSYGGNNGVRETDHGTIHGDPEVIYITSSPILGER